MAETERRTTQAVQRATAEEALNKFGDGKTIRIQVVKRRDEVPITLGIPKASKKIIPKTKTTEAQGHAQTRAQLGSVNIDTTQPIHRIAKRVKFKTHKRNQQSDSSEES